MEDMEEMIESAAELQPNHKGSQNNPFRFFSSFVCKSILFVLIVFFLPLFPSQAPDFINQTILSRGWELVHLLLVGVAVSYGLFSRRNADDLPEIKDGIKQKPEVSQSYVAQVLQVPSVFDDDEEGEDGSKTQIWNSRYYKRESTVVVTPENGVERDEVRKPLFLPVRSLKSNISDEESVSPDRLFDRGVSGGRIGSRSVSRLGDDDNFGLVPKKENVVLPSPIPWRSRSARMEVKGEVADATNSSAPDIVSSSSSSSSPSIVPRTQSFQSRRTRRASPSTSTSPSPDLRSQNTEDLVKKKSLHRPSSNPPPPPPPPPPPHHFFLQRSQYGPVNNTNYQVSRSFTDEPKVMGSSGEGETIPATKVQVNEVTTRELQNPRPPLAPKNPAEKKSGFTRKFIIDSTSDDDSNSDHDRASMSSTDGEEDDEEEETPINSTVEEQETDANEVDKKADEFIAKFREQIRLQRIESIKRSTVQKRGHKG